MSDVYEKIEQNLLYLGATAIEDKLQDGVPECIAKIAKANIKIWVLTGDKLETAINIGYSCQLLTNDMEVFTIEAKSESDLMRQVAEKRRVIDEAHAAKARAAELATTTTTMGSATSSKWPSWRRRRDPPQDHENGGKAFANLQSNSASHLQTISESGVAMATAATGATPSTDFALVINGQSLVYALNGNCEKQFLELGCLCKAVICCRVTPGQKKAVVDLVKTHKKAITLAIGDGANDVSMIKCKSRFFGFLKRQFR